MGFSKRVSNWTVNEVHDWVKKQYVSRNQALLQAIVKHAISGRALLRMSAYQLDKMSVDAELQQEILQDVLLLRVEEELENLNEIISECFSS